MLLKLSKIWKISFLDNLAIVIIKINKFYHYEKFHRISIGAQLYLMQQSAFLPPLIAIQI